MQTNIALEIKSDVLEPKTIIETKNIEFFEHIFPLKSKVDKSLSTNLEEFYNELTQSIENEPRRSLWARKKKFLEMIFSSS